MARFIIAHDLGTTGNKATLVDDEGRIVDTALETYGTEYARPKYAEQNPDNWWRAVIDSTRKLSSRVSASDQVVISFSGQMMGCLPVDKEGKPLRNSIIWADQRSEEQVKSLENSLSFEDIYHITGHRLSPSYTLGKWLWIRDKEPAVASETYKILNAKDYIVYKLTGRFLTDLSDASGTNLFDLKFFDWSETIMEAASVDRSLLPEAVPSATIAGTLTTEAAKLLNLSPDTTVAIGAGDGIAATIGAGCIEEGDAYNYLGSSSWVATTSKNIIRDEDRRTFTWAHVEKGLYSPCGTMQAAGNSMTWLKEQIAVSEGDWDGINKAAASSEPGARGLLYLPYLLGERSPWWNPEAKGAILGMTMNHKRGDLFRAVFEGISLNLGIIGEILLSGGDFKEISILGGGAASSLWLQTLADIYNLPVKPVVDSDAATSLGAAVIGGVAAGIFPDYSVVKDLISYREATSPIEENVTLFRKKKEIFQRAYRQLEPIFPEIGL